MFKSRVHVDNRLTSDHHIGAEIHVLHITTASLVNTSKIACKYVVFKNFKKYVKYGKIRH